MFCWITLVVFRDFQDAPQSYFCPENVPFVGCEAIEAKENVQIQAESVTLASQLNSVFHSNRQKKSQILNFDHPKNRSVWWLITLIHQLRLLVFDSLFTWNDIIGDHFSLLLRRGFRFQRSYELRIGGGETPESDVFVEGIGFVGNHVYIYTSSKLKVILWQAHHELDYSLRQFITPFKSDLVWYLR